MTGLLSPVALFLPGTTHDYAIWQAGPSILSSDGLARDERAEAAAAGEPVAAAVALGDGRAGQPPLNEHLPQALASHGRVLRQERLHVSDLLEQYLLEPRRVQVSGLAGTGELVELAHQVALLRLGRRLRDPRDPRDPPRASRYYRGRAPHRDPRRSVGRNPREPAALRRGQDALDHAPVLATLAVLCGRRQPVAAGAGGGARARARRPTAGAHDQPTANADHVL